MAKRPRAPNAPKDYDWKPLFLDALREQPNVSRATRAAGISRKYAYHYRDRNPDDEEFAAAWDDAIQEGLDNAKQEAWRRGIEGWDEPVFQGGKQVGVTRKYDSYLLARVIAAHDEAWRSNTTKIEGGGQGVVSKVEVLIVEPGEAKDE